MGFRMFMVTAVMGFVAIACPAIAVGTEIIKTAQSGAENPVEIPVTGENTFAGCGGTMIPVVNAEYEQAVVEQTNLLRRKNNLPPLKRVPELDDSARYHSADMGINDYFDHDTLKMIDGRMQKACDPWNRIVQYYTDWEALGENIAAGQNSPAMAMDGWINSPEHYKNMVSSEYWEIGVGYFENFDSTYRYYWDQNFGRRTGIYPLIINDEQARVDDTNVSIYVYGDWTDIRLRNDNGEWGPWMQFKPEFTWSLPDRPGPHTVTAEMRGPGTSATSSDTIQLTGK